MKRYPASWRRSYAIDRGVAAASAGVTLISSSVWVDEGFRRAASCWLLGEGIIAVMLAFVLLFIAAERWSDS